MRVGKTNPFDDDFTCSVDNRRFFKVRSSFAVPSKDTNIITTDDLLNFGDLDYLWNANAKAIND